VDEADASGALVDTGEVELLGPLGPGAGADGLGGVGVDVGEGLEEGLWVAGGQAGGALGRVAQVVVGAPVDLVGGAEAVDQEGVGLFLAPGDGALGAPDADAEVV